MAIFMFRFTAGGAPGTRYRDRNIEVKASDSGTVEALAAIKVNKNPCISPSMVTLEFMSE